MILDFDYKFSSWINVWVNWNIFEQSFWNREETLDILDLVHIANYKLRKVIWINWTAHSSDVKIINLLNHKNEVTLLDKWIDSVILTNVYDCKYKISLILWVADCAPISFSNKFWTTIWLAHAWYKWTSLDIIWNTIKELKKLWENISELEFFIWPMAWENFEFDREFYIKLFIDLSEKYEFNLDDYFYNIDFWNNKWYLDLRWIIKYVLLKNWLKNENIIFSDIETNNPNNHWPSYRLYTILNSINKKIESWEKLTKLENELFDSWNKEIFQKDKRISVFLEN